MTIKTIEIGNFQPHKVAIIEPAELFTIITGSSRAGKTSLVRAIRKAIENKPMGTGFKSWFAEDKDETSIAIVFDDDSYVVRIISNKLNGYNISTREEPLTALRADVPDEVSNITRMSSINIDSQLDPYFMLQPPYTPGEIGRMFNQAVNLEIIDATTSEAISAIRELLREKVFAEGELKKLQEKVIHYENLDEVEALLHTINDTVREKLQLENDISDIGQILLLIDRTNVQLEHIDSFLSIKEHLEPIRVLILNIKELDREIQQIQATLGMISLAESKLSKLSYELEIKDPIDEILEIAVNVSKLNSERTLIKNILRDIYNVESRFTEGTQALNDRNRELSELLRSTQLKFCPFCNQVMTEDAIKHLEEHGI